MITVHLQARSAIDLTPYVVGGTLVNGVHGDESATIQCAISGAMAAQIFASVTSPTLTVAAGGAVIWTGRLEEVEIGARQTTLTAYGYWRALADARYTALWSHSGTADWRPVQTTERSNNRPGQHQFDTNNRLYIELVKGVTYLTNSFGELGYRAPSGGSRFLTNISFDYTVNAPTGWQLLVYWWSAAPGNAAWTVIGSSAIITGSGSGSVAQALTGSPVAVSVGWRNNTGGSVTPAGETGTFFVRCTNVRVTSQATPILTSNIAADIAAQVAALNSGQLSSSAALIRPTSIDRFEEVYEDADPRTILKTLALSEGNWDVGVDQDRCLYLRPPGTFARTWAVERADLRLTRILDDVGNSVYAVYQESDGYQLRTAVSADSGSVARYGVVRRRAIDASQTTSSTQATAVRDAYLTDNATPPPRAAITIPRGGLATNSGGRAPGYLVRAGDTLRVRQLPPDLAQELDQLSTFRVGRRTYDIGSGVTTIEPLNPPDTLPVLLAQRANSNRAIAEMRMEDGRIV